MGHWKFKNNASIIGSMWNKLIIIFMCLWKFSVNDWYTVIEQSSYNHDYDFI